MTLDRDRLDDLRDLLAEQVADRGLPGGALGIATAEGPVLAALLPGTVALGPDPVWWLASISKAVCATAVLQLVGEGRVVLDEPIPGLRCEERVDRGTGGEADLQPGLRDPAITPWHLLTHTSGLADVDWETRLQASSRPVLGLDQARDAPSTFPPGTRHAYSTLTFVLLAELVARADGLPYEESLRRRVLAPAGAEGLTFDPDRSRTVPVQGLGAGLPVTPEAALDALLAQRMPGGGMWGGLDDLLALGGTLLRDARGGRARLLSRPLIRLMSTDQVRGLHRLVDGRREPASWGLGWRVGRPDGRVTLPGSDQVFEHDGAAGGALWIDPAHDLVVVFLTSSFGANGDLWRRAVQGAYGAYR